VAYYVSQTVSRSPLKTSELSSERTAERPLGGVTLLFARRIILAAFHDALHIGIDGLPTERALESVDWVKAHTDWLYHKQPIPPAEIRAENFGSFEWACQWLGEDPEHVRQCGLPRESGVFATSQEPKRLHVAGLPAVYAHWQQAREKVLARVASGWNLAAEQARRAERAKAKRAAVNQRNRDRRAACKASQTAFAGPQAGVCGGDDAHGPRKRPTAFLCDSSFSTWHKRGAMRRGRLKNILLDTEIATTYLSAFRHLVGCRYTAP